MSRILLVCSSPCTRSCQFSPKSRRCFIYSSQVHLPLSSPPLVCLPETVSSLLPPPTHPLSFFLPSFFPLSSCYITVAMILKIFLSFVCFVFVFLSYIFLSSFVPFLPLLNMTFKDLSTENMLVFFFFLLLTFLPTRVLLYWCNCSISPLSSSSSFFPSFFLPSLKTRRLKTHL